MDEQLTMQCLKEISDATQAIGNATTQIQTVIGVILGSSMRKPYQNYCAQQESSGYSPTQPLIQLNQGNGFGTQPKTIYEEIEKMIIELKINGSLREHRNGLYKFHNTIFGSVYGKTKEEIQEKLLKKIEEYNQIHKDEETQMRKDQKKNIPLLSEFYEIEYLPYKKKTLAATSINGIDIHFRFIVKNGMDKPINKYSAMEIEKFIYSIPSTRKRQLVRGVFNNIFNYAKRLGKIKQNPCDNVEQMKHEQVKGRALSFKDQCAFFNTIFDTNSKISLTERLYLVFVYLTGTRRSEAISLTVDDVDFENNVLHIPGTKTKKSDRKIPLFPLVKKLLERIDPVDGKYFNLSTSFLSHSMAKISNGYHLHELRHTFGTIAICVQKLDPKTVSLWMGHSTVGMTFTTYTHPEQLDKALFYDGSLSENEKLLRLQKQYQAVLTQISEFLS